MCYDGLEELSAANDAALKAKTDLELLEREIGSQPLVQVVRIQVTYVEARAVYQARLDAAMKRLGEAGYTPPPKRVNDGDAEAALKARGVTLPGELPAKSDPLDKPV